LKDVIINFISGPIRHIIAIFFVQYNGETKQGVNNLKVLLLCSFIELSKRNIWDKQQKTIFWYPFWPACL